MHIFNKIKFRVQAAIVQLIKHKTEVEFSVESPKKPEHGDIATNAAMVITKMIGKKPVEIAQDLVDILKQDEILSTLVRDFTVVSPGFINMHIKNDVLYNFLDNLNINGANTFKEDINIGNGKKINLEFVSANPTGPMHIGHSRSAIYGDITCKLLRKCGFNVTAEYYINDAGVQIDKLVESLYVRYLQLKGESIDLPEGG